MTLALLFGSILIPPIEQLLDAMKPFVKSFKEISYAHPQLIGNVIKATAAFVTLRIGMIAGRYGFLQMREAMLFLLRPIGMVTAALTTLRGALMLSGVDMILLIIGAARKLIHNN